MLADEIRTDQDLVRVAAQAANALDKGLPVSDAIQSTLRAIASTRDEARRHELAREAEALAGTVGTAALQLLRVAIFALSLLLAAFLPAQVVRIENFAPTPFTGWKRTTIDRTPPHQVGKVGDTVFVVGRQTGLDTWIVDVRVSLQPGQAVVLDLATSTSATWTRQPLPMNPMDWFGGLVTVGGVATTWVSLWVDGAGYTAHLRARVGRMHHVDAWITWWPDTPAWAVGEAIVTASNPTVPDLTAPAPDLRLRFGDALTILPGAGVDVPLVAPGTPFGDGQARAVPVVFVWLRHLQAATDWSSVGVVATMGLGAVGVQQLLADGNPTYPAGFSARSWTSQRFAESLRRAHTWDVGVVGPNRVSGDTGSQEDQLLVRGEALRPDGCGAEAIAYLGALKMANRPCHHLEANGRPLDPAAHVSPRLILWDGRPHWSTGVSPDQLGKSVPGLTQAQANGWWGPDVEHWLINTLAGGARLTGSPACQWLLATHATIYQMQWTTTPGWSTSAPYAARAIGWEGINAVHLWRTLEDRALAERVRAHWRARWSTIIKPNLASPVAADIWDARLNDPRLGSGWWWMPWQSSVGAYGVDLAGQHLGMPDARAAALAGARRVLADAWVQSGSGWLSRATMPVAGGGEANGSFNYFGMALSVAVVLRHDPQDARARAIWQFLVAGATLPSQTSWLAPVLL